MNDNRVKYIEYTLFVSILASLFLKFILLLHFKINWDEFFNLSKIYDFQRGDLSGPFQSFHVHLFQWLPLISANEVTQILWARGVMFLLLLGSCRYFYLIGRFFLNRPATLFALLCYLSLSNIIVHGASFRYDSIGSFLFLAAFYHLLKAPFRFTRVILAASLMALSLVLSIKASLHIVTLVCIFALLYLIQGKPPSAVRALALFSMVLIVVFFALFQFHTSTLPGQGPPASGNSNFLTSTFDTMFSAESASVGLHYFADTYVKNIFIWSILLFGIYSTVRACATDKQNHRGLLALATLSPLGTLFFYRNSFPYFYVFIVAPGFILCGVVLNKLIEDYRRKSSRTPILFSYLLIFAVLAGSAVHYVVSFRRPANPQKKLLQEVHRIFPEPVAYIDHCMAVASYPKVGFFMGTEGMQTYLDMGKPVMRKIIIRHQPKFLMADIPSLDLSLPRENNFAEHTYALLPEDWRTLQDNFVHFWNILYLPGKEFSFDSPPLDRQFEILISGIYTVEGTAPVVIDGTHLKPGAAFHLTGGIHKIAATETAQTVRLRWGQNLHKPDFQMEKQTFHGFQVVSFDQLKILP